MNNGSTRAHSEACLTECNTFSFGMTDSDSISHPHLSLSPLHVCRGKYLLVCETTSCMYTVFNSDYTNDAHMVWIRAFMLDTGFTARLVTAPKFGFKPLYLHAVKPRHLNLAVLSVSVCVSVWSVGLWRTVAQLRRVETHMTRWVFKISGVIHLPATGQRQLRSGFVFYSLEWICSCCLFLHSPHAAMWLREERPEVLMEHRNKSPLSGVQSEYLPSRSRFF